MIRHTAFALTLAATLAVSGCGGDDDATTGSTPSTTTSSTSAAPTSAAATTATAFAGTEIVVEVKNGKVTPPTHRVKVDAGTDVRLLVTSDKPDGVHVHGYEIEQELGAGDQATIEFTADQTGVFAIEMHESDLQLVQLEVR